ncbi:MAG: hypothetical protein AB7E32_11965 [Desulfovibrio sp.]
MCRIMLVVLATLLLYLDVSAPARADVCRAPDGPNEALASAVARSAMPGQGDVPFLAEWPGAPCINDADCGKLKCCNKVCAPSCRDAAPALGLLRREGASRFCPR